MKQQITFELLFEKYGKACLERDMAFDRIFELENQVNALNTQIAEMGKVAADPAPDLTEIKKPEPGPILKPLP